MPTYIASPTFARPGVLGGFNLDVGNGLVPSISLGVLIAQGNLYRPAPAQDEYNVTNATWAYTQYSVTNVIWVAGIPVTLPPRLADLLDVPTNCMLAAAIYTIGSHSIVVGQTISTGGILTKDNSNGYNTTGIVIAVTSTTVAIAMPTVPGDGIYHPPAHYTPLGAPAIPTLLAGVATVTIGAHSIQPQSLVEVSEINPTGYDLGEVYVFAATSTAIEYSVPYPPSNASPYPGPGTYVSGGVVETPETGPILPAAPADAQSWLYYNSTNGFYWQPGFGAANSGDAFLGWVVTNATDVIETSSRKIGSGPELFIVPYPLALAQIGPSSGSPAPAPRFAIIVQPEGFLQVNNVSLLGNATTPDVTSGTLTLYYVDETQGYQGTVATAIASTDTTITSSGQLVVGYVLIDDEIVYLSSVAAVGSQWQANLFAACSWQITLSGTPNAGAVITLTIGSSSWEYTIQPGDTLLTIAVALAALPVSTPYSVSATGGHLTIISLDTTLMSIGNITANTTGTGLTAAVAPGSSPATYTMTLSGTPTAGATIILNVGNNAYPYAILNTDTLNSIAAALAALPQDTDFSISAASAVITIGLLTPALVLTGTGLGATVTSSRAALGSAAAAHSIGAIIWPVQAPPMVTILPFQLGMFGTPAAAQWTQSVQFRCYGLVAATLFVTNGAGNSPTTTKNFSLGPGTRHGRLRAFSGGQITFSVPGVLAIQSLAAPIALLPQNTSVNDISAVIQQAPTGAALTCALLLNGQPFSGTLTIAASATQSNVVDGSNLLIPAQVPLSLEVTAVGTTYPGQGLTVVVRL